MFGNQLGSPAIQSLSISIYCHETANIRLADKPVVQSNISSTSKSFQQLKKKMPKK